MAENFHQLMMGISVSMQPYNFMVAMIGLVLGVIVGVLPGLGGANGVAILIPSRWRCNPYRASSCWRASTGGAVRGEHHVHPVQHPRRTVVCRDHVRRLLHGEKGQCRKSARVVVFFPLRRGGARRHHVEFLRAAHRVLRIAVRSRRNLLRHGPHVQRVRRVKREGSP